VTGTMSQATQRTPMQPPPDEPTPGWGQDLYAGAAGITLAHVETAHAGTGDWETAHRWAAAMVRHPVLAHPDACGLNRGAPAVAFALAAANQPGYAPTLTVLDRHITTLTRHRLDRAHARIDARQLPALREYDLIRGLTGIGAYLLHRERGSDEPNHGDLLRDVLAYLVRLTEPIIHDRRPRPGWWSANAPNDEPSPRWLGGHGNLGIAHGITGPLALLSLAIRRGITVAGQTEAINRICAWLDHWRTDTAAGPWWPELVSAAEQRTGVARHAGPGRPSWCYGTPGLARAQQLAALATSDQRRQRLAENALAGCLADEQQLAHLTDASLCHGWAGLLQTTWRIAADATNPERFAVPQLLQRVRRIPGRGLPLGGLLEGTTGLRLTCHTVSADEPPRSGWDTCLLLN
jgi:hypothetical protein